MDVTREKLYKKRLITPLSFFGLYVISSLAYGYGYQFGQSLCHTPQYHCVKVGSGESWASMFPSPETRLIVRKVNRMNTPLHRGMVIAVPDNLGSVSFMSLAPFPSRITPQGDIVKVNLSKLAWGAYDDSGTLINWGPVSGGREFCPDIHRGCRTITGTYTFYDRQGPGCISHIFPRPHGGAPMPYCMHFRGGYALHGSATVPGHNASHGCVRLFVEDARWLNQNFVVPGSTRVNIVR